MIKRIYIIILVMILITSCGKKGDPVFNEENENTKVFGNSSSSLA